MAFTQKNFKVVAFQGTLDLTDTCVMTLQKKNKKQILDDGCFHQDASHVLH